MSEAQQSLPEKLFSQTLHGVIDALGLEERLADDGSAYLTLASQLPMVQGAVGNVRLFNGDALFRLVTCSMVVEAMQLDSHMMFAFTPKDSAVPHFTLDSVMAGDHFAFHLDLIPRLDLGANRTYMDHVFVPLNELYAQGSAIEGLSAARLSPQQYAIMSPWMLVNRATADAFSAISDTVARYREHWLGLLRGGIPEDVLDGVTAEQLADRNLRNKRMIFDPAIDPVWNRITPLIGAEAVDATRALLLGEDE